MHMFFFGNIASKISIQLFHEFDRITPQGNIEVFQTVTDLSKRLRELYANPELLVFAPANNDELVGLISQQAFFLETPLILVLPDQHRATVQYGHLLRPRFLTFADNNLAEIGEVIANMERSYGYKLGDKKILQSTNRIDSS